jgi:hypothetical protein
VGDCVTNFFRLKVGRWEGRVNGVLLLEFLVLRTIRGWGVPLLEFFSPKDNKRVGAVPLLEFFSL